MTQHDYNIANQTFPSTRADLNTVLEAIATNNSGNTAPSATFAYQWWVDTSTSPATLKQRNDANSAWLTIAKVGDGGLYTNAGSPIGAITPDYIGQLIYDTSNNKYYFANGLTNADWALLGGNTTSLAVNYHDVNIQYVSASTIRIKAGSAIRNSDNTEDIIFTVDTDINIATSGAGGLDTGAEASNTWYYLYAIKNPTSGAVSAILSTVNETVAGSITLPSGYTKKRQLRFAVRNDTSSNFLDFYYCKATDYIGYRLSENANAWAVLQNGGAGTFTAVSCVALVPAISRVTSVTCAGYGGGTNINTLFTRETGLSSSVGQCRLQTSFAGGNWNGPDTISFDQRLSSGQQFDYRLVNGVPNYSIIIEGFYITEVK